jgi:hypothetical protein
MAQHLDRREELVHVYVQHPVGHDPSLTQVTTPVLPRKLLAVVVDAVLGPGQLEGIEQRDVLGPGHSADADLEREVVDDDPARGAHALVRCPASVAMPHMVSCHAR